MLPVQKKGGNLPQLLFHSQVLGCCQCGGGSDSQPKEKVDSLNILLFDQIGQGSGILAGKIVQIILPGGGGEGIGIFQPPQGQPAETYRIFLGLLSLEDGIVLSKADLSSGKALPVPVSFP